METVDTNSAGKLRVDYMNMLVTQLQNQDPFEPMSNEDMTAQLATLSQLEETEKMNSNIEKLNSTFEGALLFAQFDYARNLLGQDVSFYSEDYQQILTGDAKKVEFINGEANLLVEVSSAALWGAGSAPREFAVPLNGIIGVSS